MLVNNYSFLGNLILLIILLLLSTFLMFKILKISWPSFSIWLFILFSWVIFQMFISNLHINNQINFLNNWYAFPLFILIFQLVQIFSRIPLVLLARKINSKKTIVLGTILVFALSLSFVLISNFSLWSIFLCVTCSGITGSIFGMKNQQFSHNFNQNKVFSSATIVFFVPLISQVFGQVTNSLVEWELVSSFWLLIGALVFTILGFVAFCFLPKSFEQSFEHTIEQTKNDFLLERSFKDIILLTLAFTCISGFFFFVFSFNSFYKLNLFENNLILFGAILGSCFLTFFLVPKFSVQKIRFYSSLSMFLLFVALGLFTSLNLLNKWVWITLSCLGSFAFGINSKLLFSAALNLDNQNRFLVFAFLLSVNSLFIGTSSFLGSLITYKLKPLPMGLSIITYGTVVFAVCQMLFSSYKNIFVKQKTIICLNRILKEAQKSEIR